MGLFLGPCAVQRLEKMTRRQPRNQLRARGLASGVAGDAGLGGGGSIEIGAAKPLIRA